MPVRGSRTKASGPPALTQREDSGAEGAREERAPKGELEASEASATSAAHGRERAQEGLGDNPRARQAADSIQTKGCGPLAKLESSLERLFMRTKFQNI